MTTGMIIGILAAILTAVFVGAIIALRKKNGDKD